MDAHEVLDVLIDWFTQYSDQNSEGFRVDTDGVARIRGEFELAELADFLVDQING